LQRSYIQRDPAPDLLRGRFRWRYDSADLSQFGTVMTDRIDRRALVEDFDGGFRPRPQRLIGLEYELIGVLDGRGEAVPFDGGRASVTTVLEQMAARHSWSPVGDGPLLELERDGSRITLEPGSQIELSARALATLDEVRDELDRFVSELRDVSCEIGVCWLPLGMQPLSHADDVRVIPKPRYAIMTRYLPTRGALALWMMRTTAGMQVNLDVMSPAEAAQKLRLALRLCPAITALFANSPLSEGGMNGFATRRGYIWHEVDPDRCGIPPRIIAAGATTGDYVDWALDAGMFFIERDGELVDMTGVRFGDFLERGARGHEPTLPDWTLHLTTLFPEARLKSYLELRCADANRPELALAYSALAAGLFYGSDDTVARLEALVGGWTAEQLVELHEACTREGLSASAPGGVRVHDLARELVTLAAASLEQARPADRAYLAPVEELVERGRTPADDVRDAWGGSLAATLPRLECIESTRGSRRRG
jgi:glutamate--cysteine ligase